jgi:hypothetical protein
MSRPLLHTALKLLFKNWFQVVPRRRGRRAKGFWTEEEWKVFLKFD